MYISNLESGTVSRQTAGTQCRETSLMCQLTQGVILIHELGQLGRTEELLHRCSHGLYVDQGLRRNIVIVMRRHTLTDYSLHSGKTDTVLVLQKLTHRTDTSVAQMVNIVIVAQTILQMHIIVDGSKNVFLGNVLGNKCSS